MELTKPFVLILSPFTPFAATMAQGLVSPRTQANLFSFLLLKGEINEVKNVPESPAGTRMTHLMWMGAKCSRQADPWPWWHLKQINFTFPCPDRLLQKRRNPHCQGCPLKTFPAVLSSEICLGAVFQEHFSWGCLILSHPLQVCAFLRPAMGITCFEHCKSLRAMQHQEIHQIRPCSSDYFVTSCSYNGQVWLQQGKKTSD